MKHAVILGGIVLLAFVLSVDARKPVDDQGVPFGNGFPSGKHFNLNIIAKKDDFTCPAPEYDPCDPGQQIFGNVIFIPRVQGDDPITILMESGKKGPKNAQEVNDLQVIDWCSESFPDHGSNDGDEAIIRLPANDNGYAVYARLAGKPGENGEPNVTFEPNLVYVEDEAGNNLILLGLVDRQGVSTFSSDGETIFRTTTEVPTKGKAGRGVQKATNITALFQWTGEVCYVQDDNDIYCADQNCTPLELCCIDDNNDGIYEDCNTLEEVGVISDGNLVCPNDANYVSVTAMCRSYENEWIFNIGDFVGYLWDIDTTGAYVIKVRFYPL